MNSDGSPEYWANFDRGLANLEGWPRCYGMGTHDRNVVIGILHGVKTLRNDTERLKAELGRVLVDREQAIAEVQQLRRELGLRDETIAALQAELAMHRENLTGQP